MPAPGASNANTKRPGRADQPEPFSYRKSVGVGRVCAIVPVARRARNRSHSVSSSRPTD